MNSVSVTRLLSLLVLSLIVAAIGVLTSRGVAIPHFGGYGGGVPRELVSRAPMVDGQCGIDEYANAGGAEMYPLSSDSTLYLLATDTNFYVCADNMARGTMIERNLRVAIDAAHDGGRAPDSDDLEFRLDESGDRTAARGTGTIFVTDPSITNWTGTSVAGAATWSAEYEIGLAIIGGGAPDTTVGFAVEDITNTSFGWPAFGERYVPNTWADMVWGPPTATGLVQNLHRDVWRVTQGLDQNGANLYRKILGKTTLVRAQLYTVGPTDAIFAASCRIQRLLPTVGPVVDVPATLPGRVNRAWHGYFVGSGNFDCWWTPESSVGPQTYRFQISVLRLFGDVEYRQVIDLGTKQFWPTGRLRLFYYPWADLRPGAYFPRSWGPDLTAQLVSDTADFWRMYPLRDSITAIRAGVSSSHTRTADGLRYLIYPAVDACRPADGNCAILRTRGHDALVRANARWARRESELGIPFERLDWGEILEAVTTANVGGQSCWSGQRVGGSYYSNATADPGRTSASVLIQEVSHCLGQVRSSSPNFDGGAHSINATVPQRSTLVNTVNRSDVQPPIRSVMFPGVCCARQSFMEAWEWNDLRQVLLSIPNQSLAASPASLAGVAGGGLFHFVGAIDTGDVISPHYSQAVFDLPLELTNDNANGAYQLVLLDKFGSELGSLGFDPDFEPTHDGIADTAGLVLTVPLPEGAERAEIRKAAAVLWGQNFSAAPPALSNMVAAETPDGIQLDWSASDADNDSLKYSVSFQATADAFPLLIASGLTQNSFLYKTDLAPATTDGRLVVEATDGFNMVEMTSNSFTIAEKPPVVKIATPLSGATLVAGQTLD